MQNSEHHPARTDHATVKGHSPNFVRSQETPVSSIAQNSFDALDYARISSIPTSHKPTNTRSANPITPDSQSDRPSQANDSLKFSNDLDIPYGELDPYVDPAEHMKNQTLNHTPTVDHLAAAKSPCSIDLANQALEKIQGFEQALLENETSHVKLTGPTVEVIAAEPVDNAGQGSTSTCCSAIPILNQETGEVVYDVRDFSDAAGGVIDLLPGAFEVDPEHFDYQTPVAAEAPEVDVQETPNSTPTPEMYVNPIDDNQIFIAGSGDVIEVNGSEGFDHIDLACFDVACATFADQVIRIDNQQGASFEVRYQDVDYALFANGVEVRLDSVAATC